MENGKQGAFACVDSQKQYLQEGLTKREYFAGLAMQGILGGRKQKLSSYDADFVCKKSTEFADELLKQLDNIK
jgi:hypothetical protein